MLCPGCGYYTDTDETVCPECGEILRAGVTASEGGAEAIRQGKRARQAIRDAAGAAMATEAKRRRRSGASHATVEMPAVKDDRDDAEAFLDSYTVSEDDTAGEDGEAPSFERRRRSVYDESAALEEQAQAYVEWIEKGGRQRLKMVNWMKISLILIALVIFAAVGIWLFLKETEQGQKLLARMGKEASSSALWAVGEDLMNTGDMDGAIASFEKAKAQDDAEDHVDPDGLLMLGSAYESAGRIDEAAALYEEIYTKTPSRSEAYVNHIRILLNSGKKGDQAKAGELMKTAYEMTGESAFLNQRRDFLPAMPKVDLTAAYYESKKYITIWSEQGYDVYYTFRDNAELPADGKLWTEKVFLDEGIWNLRAVAVNGELVSDELRGTYKIIMPSPQTPQCNLAPGPYKTRQKVRLKPGQDNKNDDDIVIYYTVDGSNPDADCPIYTGEPVQLPSGHTVTLKAVAVNKYNKVSNMLEVKYKIEAKPFPLTAWQLDETISGLELNKTTQKDFEAAYGEGKLTEMEQTGDFESECRKYEYSWGYVVMNLVKRNWVMVELYFENTGTFNAPRGTGVGDSMDYVVGKFKDLGQLPSASRNRGLYALDSGSDGKIWMTDEKTEACIIRYRIRNDGHWYILDYNVDVNGHVASINYRYIPK